MDDRELELLAQQVAHLMSHKGLKLVSTESCTGGWVGQVVTALPGSSAWYIGGFITYANDAKQDWLGVQGATLATHGAVSEAVVTEMANGALQRSTADIALAISGVAGPSGGSAEKPVGTVCLAWASRDGVQLATTCRFAGDRREVRMRSVAAALRGVIELLN